MQVQSTDTPVHDGASYMMRSARAARRWTQRLARTFAYALALAPVFTDWLETGHLPTRPRDYITEIIIGSIIALGIAAIHRNTDRLRAIADYDVLTGLGNRRKFTEDLRLAVETAHRLTAPLSLVYIDVDAFKAINDRFGHGMGDAALAAVARLLQEAARRRLDACYRIGGDEFALLLIGDGPAGTNEVLQHIYRHRCRAQWNAAQCTVELSCGAVQLQERETAEAFLRRADANMYRAKRARKPLGAPYLSGYTLP